MSNKKNQFISSFLMLSLKSWAALLPIVVAVVFSVNDSLQELKQTVGHLHDLSVFEEQTEQIPKLIKIQEDAVVSMILDPETLVDVSEKKIEAYDQTMAILEKIKSESPNKAISEAIDAIKSMSEDKIAMIEMEIMEAIFEDQSIAIKKYLNDYNPIKEEFNQKITNLYTKIKEHIYAQEQITLANNKKATISNMLVKLAGIFLVFLTLGLLSYQIARGREEQQTLLNSINEGLFFFSKCGTVSEVRSKRIDDFFPSLGKFKSIDEFFKFFDPNHSKEKTDEVLSLLWPEEEDAFFSLFENTISLWPKKVYHSNINDEQRLFALKFKPIYKNSTNEIKEIVVGIEDITERHQLEEKQVQQKKRIERIQKASSNIEVYREFSLDVISLIIQVDKALDGKETKENLDRDLHSLKGNLSMFHFYDISEKIHSLESMQNKTGDYKAAEFWETIKDQWKFESSDIEQVIGLRQFDNKVLIKKEKLFVLKERSKEHSELHKQVKALEYNRIDEVFSKYTELISKLSNNSDHKQAQVVFDQECDEVHFDEINKISNCLVHIFRNFFDHGIETKIDREKHGKNPTGKINVSCFRKNEDSIHLVLKDDGQGINVDKLCLKAIEKKVLTSDEANKMSYQDKLNLIFKDSISSRDSVTELSGRGVGMSAVLEEIQRIGGKITVFSHPGQGTQFEIDIPSA